MSFEQFAESHGLIIDNIISDRWVRVPTRDKPTKRNGSYIWDGHSGAVQNWAIHEKPIVSNSEGRDPFYRAKRVTSDNNIQESRKKAVSKANPVNLRVCNFMCIEIACCSSELCRERYLAEIFCLFIYPGNKNCNFFSKPGW